MTTQQLTCDEVNRAIAEMRGEYRLPNDLGIPVEFGGCAAWRTYQQFFDRYKVPPDYTHDWRWAGVLLEELASAPNSPVQLQLGLTCGHVALRSMTDGCKELYVVYGIGEGPSPRLTEAIARAWLAWKEGGKNSDSHTE